MACLLDYLLFYHSLGDGYPTRFIMVTNLVCGEVVFIFYFGRNSESVRDFATCIDERGVISIVHTKEGEVGQTWAFWENHHKRSVECKS